jgi:hypothetical protein
MTMMKMMTILVTSSMVSSMVMMMVRLNSFKLEQINSKILSSIKTMMMMKMKMNHQSHHQLNKLLNKQHNNNPLLKLLLKNLPLMEFQTILMMFQMMQQSVKQLLMEPKTHNKLPLIKLQPLIITLTQ